jgi:hypothetical protein
VLLRALKHAAHNRAFRRTNLQQTHLVQQIDPGFRLHVAPQVIGPEKQRHVIRMLKIRLPDHPRLAVRAAAVVPTREAVDAEHFRPALGRVISRGAPHAAGAENDDVVHSWRFR